MARRGEKPLYRRIAEDLLRTIRSSSPHGLLPSETMLVEQYGVSRGTVKQALDELEQHGLIYRRQGKGSFVAEPRVVRDAKEMPNFRQDLRQRGYEPSVRVIKLEEVEVTEKVSDILKVPLGTSLWKTSRLFLADQTPFALTLTFIPRDFAPNITILDLEISLYDALELRYGCRPRWARDSYTAVLSRGETAKQLNISVNEPILFSERIAYLNDMTPIEYTESFIRGDKFTVMIDWLPPET